jgi:hypothetical protein
MHRQTKAVHSRQVNKAGYCSKGGTVIKTALHHGNASDKMCIACTRLPACQPPPPTATTPEHSNCKTAISVIPRLLASQKPQHTGATSVRRFLEQERKSWRHGIAALCTRQKPSTQCSMSTRGACHLENREVLAHSQERQGLYLGLHQCGPAGLAFCKQLVLQIQGLPINDWHRKGW